MFIAGVSEWPLPFIGEELHCKKLLNSILFTIWVYFKGVVTIAYCSDRHTGSLLVGVHVHRVNTITTNSTDGEKIQQKTDVGDHLRTSRTILQGI